MTDTKKTKVLIIGSGPAGYTAAVYAARANLKPIQALGLQPGGQLTITTDVENYPGFAEVIQGPWLMEQMRAQAEHVGAEMIEDMIDKVDFSSRPFKCWTDGGDLIEAETVIISTGAQARWLGLESEEKFRGYGVSGCATCDGFFYKGKKVMVVGGGNTAVEEAIYLTNFAEEVILVHRRDSLRAEKIAQERLFKNQKIRIIWDSAIDEIMGTDSPKSVNKVRLMNVKTNEMQYIDVDGVFIAIGHTPMSDLFKGQINLDEEGYILVKNGATGTNIEGVFAAGDVQDKVFRQAVTAAGQGCMAALEVERFLHNS
ncbi:thioredoxin-disulfide reductase [Candidatus Paracaedibacter symbiosus]|uniref:thioredoxin-disulfide reductase n=1 Tax=Candidatus Paracaedibacter symbiosus TaxID=244582 RepID=UPI0005093A87|nr:thioredoxin-disulfide reductase [Candidatus Paracaedibacter symbiosus]